MAKEEKKQSFWVIVFKLIFASILLLSVASGTFLLGTKTLGTKMQAEQMIHTALGADLIMEGSKGKK
ncbi:MAG: hypothetical protein ACI4N3_05450 [Alphaproteobacteria bacterium]